ncbi:MAG: NAD(P)/FAD-dependent oxidoreductase [Leptolyngbyaceae cyanobacterium]
MTRVVIVGCGIIGAMVAYELSRQPHFTVTVIDQHRPGQGATGAALGILMGVISHKTKGRNWRLREESLRRYETLLPELEALTGISIPHNRQGILSLCTDAEALPRWESLQARRERQGWPLEIWSPQQVKTACPHLEPANLVAGIYSPCDLQIAPKALTQALVESAKHHGADCIFNSLVTGFQAVDGQVNAVKTPSSCYSADAVVITAGLGSAALSQSLGTEMAIGPVLGQGIRVRMPFSLGNEDFQPVINSHDVHLVPLGNREYGVAATVEFPPDNGKPLQANPSQLEAMWQVAVNYCPFLIQGKRLEQWQGLRPRPQGRPAPIIEPLADYANVWLATGHYRNGVFLAPATAQQILQSLQNQLSLQTQL